MLIFEDEKVPDGKIEFQKRVEKKVTLWDFETQRLTKMLTQKNRHFNDHSLIFLKLRILMLLDNRGHLCL